MGQEQQNTVKVTFIRETGSLVTDDGMMTECEAHSHSHVSVLVVFAEVHCVKHDCVFFWEHFVKLFVSSSG